MKKKYISPNVTLDDVITKDVITVSFPVEVNYEEAAPDEYYGDKVTF